MREEPLAWFTEHKHCLGYTPVCRHVLRLYIAHQQVMLSRALKEDPSRCPALSSADINDGQRGIVLHSIIAAMSHRLPRLRP